MLEWIQNNYLYIIGGLTAVIIVSSIVIYMQNKQIEDFKEILGLTKEDLDKIITLFNQLKDKDIIERIERIEECLQNKKLPSSPTSLRWIPGEDSSSNFSSRLHSYAEDILMLYLLVTIILIIISIYIIRKLVLDETNNIIIGRINILSRIQLYIFNYWSSTQEFNPKRER